MRYLLDTYVILWLAFEEEKLSKKVKKILTRSDVEIYLSAVSFWEISLKFKTGKLDLKIHNPETLQAGFDQFFEHKKLNLSFEDSLTFYKLEPQFHKDPFDRMLIWQALRHDLILISIDEQMKPYQSLGLKLIW